MTDIEINEIDADEETEEYEDGSFLATAAVIGVGALLGFVAAKGYDKVKETVQIKLNDRRARKILDQMEYIETTGDETE